METLRQSRVRRVATELPLVQVSAGPRTLLLAFAVTAFLGSVARRGFSQTRSDVICQASGFRWSHPVARAAVRFAWPELAVGQRSDFVFGFHRGRSRAQPRGIVAVRDVPEEIGPPPAAVEFFDPVLAVDRTGTLHAVWGEHEPEDSKYFADQTGFAIQMRLARVLYARYQHGR